jgi:hypothetical protein
MASCDMALIPIDFQLPHSSIGAGRRPMPIAYGIYRRRALERAAQVWLRHWR